MEKIPACELSVEIQTGRDVLSTLKSPDREDKQPGTTEINQKRKVLTVHCKKSRNEY